MKKARSSKLDLYIIKKRFLFYNLIGAELKNYTWLMINLTKDIKEKLKVK